MGSNGYIWLYLNTGSSSVPSYGGGTKLKANDGTYIYSGDSWGTFALIDMNGDDIKDLVLSDLQSRLCVYKNTATAGSSPVFAPCYFVKSTVTGTALVLPDRRFDIGDWNKDGLPDVVSGASCADVNLYLGTNTTKSPAYGTSTVLMSNQCYNWYPRLFDINNNGVVDLVRGINWGDIIYWLDPGRLGTASSTTMTITTSAGTAVSVKPLTDGAIVDFGDLNGDGFVDMIFGGHSNTNNIYDVYGTIETT